MRNHNRRLIGPLIKRLGEPLPLRFAQLTRELGLDEYWRRTNSRALVVA